MSTITPDNAELQRQVNVLRDALLSLLRDLSSNAITGSSPIQPAVGADAWHIVVEQMPDIYGDTYKDSY